MPTAYCANHPDLEAVARCKGCRKLLCTKCRIRGHDGWYCSKDCMGRQKRQQQDVQAIDAGRGRGGGLGRILVPIVIIAAVGGAAYWLFGVEGVRTVDDLRNLISSFGG